VNVRLLISCASDVGVVSRIQQVIVNLPWAIQEGRISIVYVQAKTGYWTPTEDHAQEMVWEYSSEPVVTAYPASSIPQYIRAIITTDHSCPHAVGDVADKHTCVSNHVRGHPARIAKTLSVPSRGHDPDDTLRQEANDVIRRSVQPRYYIQQKASHFFYVHNGWSLARTVLLNAPHLPHTNTHLKEQEHSGNAPVTALEGETGSMTECLCGLMSTQGSGGAPKAQRVTRL
jgi:hypothetical protein